jgi:hypothetical protein
VTGRLLAAIRRLKEPLFITAVFVVGWANGVGMGWGAAKTRYSGDFVIGQVPSAPWWVGAADVAFAVILIAFIALAMPYLPRTIGR